MLFALDAAGVRIEPSKGARGVCPQCGSETVAKCGELVSWHWAHRVRECDAWAEGESEWHLGWKRRAEPLACEVVIGPHRADIRTAAGVVVELQHSPISAPTIAEREAFYGELVWIFDASTFELDLYPSGATLTFSWHRPRKSLLEVTRPMYWDLGHDFALRVERLFQDPALGVRGNGVLVDTSCLASALFGASARPEIHELALNRAPRVGRCLALAYEELRRLPQDGIDEALRRAMRRT
jgi:competence protein CoiA